MVNFSVLSREEMEPLAASQQAQVIELSETLHKAMTTIADQKRQIAALQNMLFGRKSERLVDTGTPLLPGLILPEPAGQPEDEVKTTVEGHDRKVAKPHQEAGWNAFPENLPREEVVIDLPEAEKQGLKLVDYDVSERLVHRQEYFVRVIKRAKYVFPDYPGLGVAAPEPLPNVLSENSDRAHYDLSVPVHLIADKFINHLPFYRQSEDLKRQGIVIGRSLMCSWMMASGRLLEPLGRRLAELVMGSPVVHADETGVRMLDKGKCRRCYIWVRKTGVSPPLTVFHFAPNRNQETALKLMGDYLGTYISDACSAYDLLPGTRSGCWAHARRKFFEVPTLNDPDRLEVLRLIRLMYMNERLAVDAAARSQAETALVKARKTIRRQTRTHVEEYFRRCEKIIASGRPPSDPLVKAANYSLKQKEPLMVFLDNPHAGIDNNPAENAIRPWALGRKNWLFVGNDHGGEVAALINSLVVTCKDNGVDFEAWLLDILPRLATTPSGDIDTLLPHVWKPQSKQD